jgi:hypothetical protein
MWKSKTLHGRHVYDLETPDADTVASNAWLKAGELFPKTTGFMIATQDQVITTNNYKKCILKDPNITNDICRKCREKSETIQQITFACRALAQGYYTHPHSQVASIVHEELAIKRGLSEGTTNAVL